jgi:hypothetical protein
VASRSTGSAGAKLYTAPAPESASASGNEPTEGRRKRMSAMAAVEDDGSAK